MRNKIEFFCPLDNKDNQSQFRANFFASKSIFCEYVSITLFSLTHSSYVNIIGLDFGTKYNLVKRIVLFLSEEEVVKALILTPV